MNGKYTYAQLQDLLDEGNSIEEIFDKSIMSCRNKMLVFNNNRLTTTEAVRQAGISMRWFNIKVAQEAKRQGVSSRKLPEESRQRIFEQLVLETKKTDEQGIICFSGKTWMLLSDEDASSIIKRANIGNFVIFCKCQIVYCSIFIKTVITCLGWYIMNKCIDVNS